MAPVAYGMAETNNTSRTVVLESGAVLCVVPKAGKEEGDGCSAFNYPGMNCLYYPDGVPLPFYKTLDPIIASTRSIGKRYNSEDSQ